MNTITPALTIGQTRLLATVIKTTRNMLALAEDEAWDAVADLEVLRREDLKRCFEIPVVKDQGGVSCLGARCHFTSQRGAHESVTAGT